MMIDGIMIATESQFLFLTLAAMVGYLPGSIPFGLILTQLAGLGDIRNFGSGNVGATNVLRTGHKGLAAATLVLDSGKGALAVLAAHSLWGVEAGLMAGFWAVIGHNFPVWLRFKGGKGVATTLGVLLAASWPVGGLVCLTWLAMAFLFRYSSLAALAALSASPIFTWFLASPSHTIMAAALAILALIRHRSNIQNLQKGKEPKIGEKKGKKILIAGGPDNAP